VLERKDAGAAGRTRTVVAQGSGPRKREQERT
jgi:hypothetical protein